VTDPMLWSPFREVEELMDAAFTGFPEVLQRASPMQLASGAERVLALDVQEEGGQLVIKADLPGVRAQDLKVRRGRQVLLGSGAGPCGGGWYLDVGCAQARYTATWLPTTQLNADAPMPLSFPLPAD
jgi:hypothetical protein